MPKTVDLTGKKFGEWTVLFRAENKGREVMWHCQCSCGAERDVNAKSLKKGASTSCGCTKENRKNIVGKRFTKLIVISQDGNKCHCKCDCGNEVTFTTRELLQCRKKSCGCSRHQDENLVGQRFEKLVAIKKMKKDGYTGYLCRCDCGNEIFFESYKLRNGIAKSCGCKRFDFHGKDLTGKRFGHWVVQSFAGVHKDVYYWHCKCDCGTERDVAVKLLKNGKSKSCGCAMKGTKKHLEGTKIGRWTFLSNVDALRWKCRCDCGNEKIVYASNVEQGLSTSCGCADISHNGSKVENEIKDYIHFMNPLLHLEKDRLALDGKEIDIYIPSLKLGIEYNGSAYHATENAIYVNKPKLYHQQKFLLAKEKGIHLINIFDVDWNDKLKKYLKDLIIPPKKIYARNCELKEISTTDAKTFVDKYHLQGSTNNMLINYGLYHDDELVSVMSFGNIRMKHKQKHQFEISRYVTKFGTVVVGGANKLFSHFVADYQPSYVLSYSDNDYFTGNIYSSLGFKFDGYTTPSYYWFLGHDKIPRSRCQPQQLKKKYPDLYDPSAHSIEVDIMTKLGARRIYRCGNTRWVYKQ